MMPNKMVPGCGCCATGIPGCFCSNTPASLALVVAGTPYADLQSGTLTYVGFVDAQRSWVGPTYTGSAPFYCSIRIGCTGDEYQVWRRRHATPTGGVSNSLLIGVFFLSGPGSSGNTCSPFALTSYSNSGPYPGATMTATG